jgi:hypothetical protein
VGTNVVQSQQITHWPAQAATNQDNREVDMNKQIRELMQQAGTDTSGKWMSVDNAEKFAMLVIQAYNKELKESRREVKSDLGYSRIGLRNV